MVGKCNIGGTHRNWAKIKNTHGSATSIMKLTGKAALIDLNFNLGTGSGNGVIMTHGGCRGYHLQFVGEDLAGAATALEIVGGTNLKHAKFADIHMLGHKTHMTGLKLDKCSRGLFKEFQIHECLKGVHIVNAVSVSNTFNDFDIGECNGGAGIGMDIDAGNEQHITNPTFHHNDINIDDGVGDHIYKGVEGNFPSASLPDNFVGVNLPIAGAGNVWGADTEILTALSRTKPFRVVGVSIEADTTEKFKIRLSNNSGTTHFVDFQIEGNLNVNKRESISLPSRTEYIFNYATKISGSAKSESGGNNAKIWLEIQEI